MKVFKSSSFTIEFTSSRANAIESAKKYLNSIVGSAGLEPGQRFTWRADDDSGFTLTISKGLFAVCCNKWNAARN